MTRFPGPTLTPASPAPPPPVKWKEDGVGDCSLQDYVKGTQEAGSWGQAWVVVSWEVRSKLELPTEGKGWAGGCGLRERAEGRLKKTVLVG